MKEFILVCGSSQIWRNCVIIGKIFIVGSRERKGEGEDEYEWMNEYEYLG